MTPDVAYAVLLIRGDTLDGRQFEALPPMPDQERVQAEGQVLHSTGEGIEQAIIHIADYECRDAMGTAITCAVALGITQGRSLALFQPQRMLVVHLVEAERPQFIRLRVYDLPLMEMTSARDIVRNREVQPVVESDPVRADWTPSRMTPAEHD